MGQSHFSWVIFAAFGVLGLAALIAVALGLVDWLRPIGMVLRGWFGACGAAVSRMVVRRRSGDSGTRDDGLDDDMSGLLSMVQAVSVVVDGDDAVILANPAAYALGVVDDDAIVDARVLDAVHEVRGRGGRVRFDLTTRTPERYAVPQEDTWVDRGTDVQGVSRPNWLKVTVGRVGEGRVVVLLEDVSDIVRFTQVRESFLTNVSDRLLEPTHALERLADVLERDHLDPERVREAARQVRGSSHRLNRMVADLLLLIRVQEPIVPSSDNRCMVGERLEHVCREMARQCVHADVSLVVDCVDGLAVNGDGGQIAVAVAKLVDNAVRYSPPGAKVVVSARESADGTQALIRVVDCGIGIPRREQARIFERFYRGTNQNERTGDGMGLGLAIVKHVALAHCGGVTVWSAPGQGSTFTLALPRAR